MPLKKILIAYSSKPPIIEYLKRAFERAGVEAFGFYSEENTLFDRHVIHNVNKAAHNLRILPKNRDFFSAHPLAHLNYRSSNLLKRVNSISPDLVLIIRGIRFREDVLREIKSKTPVFGWWIEKEERMEEAFREIGLFDHCFFMNSSCVDEGARRGLSDKISLLHHSIDKEAFYPVDSEKRYDWSFVGGWSEKRQAFIERAVKVSAKAAVWGRRWRKKNLFNPSILKTVKGDYIEGDDLARLYSETRVVLNITNWGFGEGEKRSGMNMRVLEVPACGTCLLTDGSRDLKKMVTPGRHVIVYEGMDDFADKLKFLLENPGKREEVAKEGYLHVTSNYTYDHVARIIIERYLFVKR